MTHKARSNGPLYKSRDVKASLTYNDLSDGAQDVWTASDLSAKQTALRKMVDQFTFQTKQAMFYRVIDSLKNPARADKLAADLVLADGDPVMRY